MMKYGIAIFPSKEVQDEANALRKRYDPHYALVAPHITLKAGFEMDSTLRDKMIDELDEITKNVKPFKIEINKVSTFAPVTNTVYFKVEPTPELQELHDKMHQGIFPVEKEHSFVPHITIAQELIEEEYHDVFGRLKLNEVKLEDTIDRIQLCYQLENGSWQVHETFLLGQY